MDALPKPLRLLFLFGLPVATIALFSFLSRDHQMDDALIYLRYVRNFHDGQGLVYNPGEYFNAVTSPLYLLVLIVLSYLIQDLQLTAIVASGLALAGASIIGARLFADDDLERFVTALALGSFAFFYWNFGMETMLFLFLIALTLYLYKRDSEAFVLAACLVALTRIEGALLGVVLGLHFLWSQRRLPAWRWLVPAAVVFVLPFTFNYFYYGAWLPATGSAKIGQGSSGLWGEGWLFLNVRPMFGLVFKLNVWSLLIGSGLLAVGLYNLRANAVARLGVVFGVLLFAVYTLFNVPNYNWYYVPFLFLALLIGCRGLAILTSLAWMARSRLPAAVAAVPLVALVIAGGVLLSGTVSFVERRPLAHYRGIGTWLAANSTETSSVGLAEVGTVGWYSGRRIVDSLGLVSPLNADHVARREFFSWLTHDQPDYLVRHVPPSAHDRSIVPFEEAGLYSPVAGLDVPGFMVLRRRPGVSDAQIAALAQSKASRTALMESIVVNYLNQHPDHAPFVRLSQDLLFAHPPLSLEARSEGPGSSLVLGYGIDPAAAELHNGVCFFIESPGQAQALFSDCIEPGAASEDLLRWTEILLTDVESDTLVLRNACMISCDYAWAYWRDIEFKQIGQPPANSSAALVSSRVH